jgi:hypothetical protein
MTLARDPRCSFVVDPGIDRTCQQAVWWAVLYRVGTARHLVDPLFRCNDHLPETVRVLSRMEYDTGYLESVVRIAVYTKQQGVGDE